MKQLFLFFGRTLWYILAFISIIIAVFMVLWIIAFATWILVLIFIGYEWLHIDLQSLWKQFSQKIMNK